MGALCNCNARSQNSHNQLFSFPNMRDPRLADLSTHIRILDAKLNSGMTSIEDFKQLLIETKKEPILHKDILNTINQIEEALNEAKGTFIHITARRNQAKTLMEQVDSQLAGRLARASTNESNSRTSISVTPGGTNGSMT